MEGDRLEGLIGARCASSPSVCSPASRSRCAPGRRLRAPCDPPVQNPIVCENSKPGNPPSEWDVSGAGSATIQGFATDISVDQGETVHFKIDTDATDYRLDIYRLGYYGGDGARKVATRQPVGDACRRASRPASTDAATGLIDCGNWAVSASWAVPADAVSGIYFAKLVRDDGTARREPHRLRRPRRRRRTPTSCSRPPTRPGRPTTATAATASTSAGPGPTGPRLQGQLQPPVHDARRRAPRTGSSTPSTRWSAGSSATATTSATSPASTPTAAAPRSSSTRCSSPSATTSTGRAAQRANVEAARDAGVQPRVLQRQRDLLEDALGEQHRRLEHRPPHARLLQGDARQRQDRSRSPTSGPAPGATRASARRPTAAGPRTR